MVVASNMTDLIAPTIYFSFPIQLYVSSLKLLIMPYLICSLFFNPEGVWSYTLVRIVFACYRLCKSHAMRLMYELWRFMKRDRLMYIVQLHLKKQRKRHSKTKICKLVLLFQAIHPHSFHYIPNFSVPRFSVHSCFSLIIG